MKKKATALVVAASVAMSALVNPVGLTAQEITAADLYEPSITPIGALEAGPTEELSFFLSDEGPEFLDMEILEFDSPYPVTYRVETLNGFREYINITLEKKKIYPAAFNVPVKVRVNYTDGSSEIVTGDFPIHPLASLVADSPAAPKSSTQQTTAPVTKTVTKTVTPAPVAAPTTKVITTTVTPAPVTTTVTPVPVTTTVTPAPVTTTVTPAAPAAKTEMAAVTVTETATETVSQPAPVITEAAEKQAPTVTVTAPATTVTKTVEKPAKPNAQQDKGSSLSTGAIVGIVLAILAAAGGAAAAVAGDVLPAGILPR
ncbi:hypothetical protein [Corynebacterium hadale]|uniref:hypothetical protein n=1 Tax=Corynebacterium hadale TaxID=2026255 RepID=UPI000BAA6AE5|nr:hypothetical protein [Corynebacterium hadale]PAT07490.1 hypothetical protein CKJ82_09895 [Corynebacterium hadale]